MALSVIAYTVVPVGAVAAIAAAGASPLTVLVISTCALALIMIAATHSSAGFATGNDDDSETAGDGGSDGGAD
jgi:hypothetical protein